MKGQTHFSLQAKPVHQDDNQPDAYAGENTYTHTHGTTDNGVRYLQNIYGTAPRDGDYYIKTAFTRLGSDGVNTAFCYVIWKPARLQTSNSRYLHRA